MIDLVYPSQQIKQAETAYPIHPLLQNRWSPRAFASRPVEIGKLRSVLEAARWSPSGGNVQPWRFVVATQDDPAACAALASVLNPSNAEWAANAPVLILTVAQMITPSGRSNGHAFHDVGLATQSLIVQALSLGLYVHPMAGFSTEKARAVVGIPDNYEPVTMLALGYLGDPESLSEQRRTQELAPRVRKPLDELVFGLQWESPSKLLE